MNLLQGMSGNVITSTDAVVPHLTHPNETLTNNINSSWAAAGCSYSQINADRHKATRTHTDKGDRRTNTDAHKYIFGLTSRAWPLFHKEAIYF